jgi:hypothetical protein
MSDNESFKDLGSTPTSSMDQFSYGSTGSASVEKQMQSTEINHSPSVPSSLEKENVMEISAQTEANNTVLNSSQQFPSISLANMNSEESKLQALFKNNHSLKGEYAFV